MKPVLENAILGSHLDCQLFSLANVKALTPVPNGLLGADDSRLDDPRPVVSGSVSDVHVADKAGIDQSKLNLNGFFPTGWFYNPLVPPPTDVPMAARGDQAELVARKGTNNGYAGLDANGKLASGNVTIGGASGTVSAVKLVMPPELVPAPGSLEASGVFSVAWANVPDGSWFGVFGIGLNLVPTPKFQTGQLPMELIPDLDAAKFTSGIFPVDRFPVAVGMAGDHHQGIVPDPGESGDPDDYLGRDMKWHRFDASKSYQPVVPTPNIVWGFPTRDPSLEVGSSKVTVSCPLKNAVLFYRVAPSTDNNWKEAHPPGTVLSLTVTPGQTVYAYAAKAGYNNSSTVSFTVPILVSEPEDL